MAFSIKVRVTAHDIDTNTLATPTSVAKYMMEAVDSNMLACSPSYQELMNKGLSFVVSRNSIQVFRPLREYEELTVETWATPSKNVSFPRSYRIMAGDETVAAGLAIWALIDLKEEKLLKGSDFSVEGYGIGDPIELGLPTRFRLPADAPFEKCGEKQILYSDVDRNFHMNNTKYYDMLCDYIPNRESVYMSSAMINFVSEAPLGCKLDIYMSEGETSEDETIYYFYTETEGKTNIQARIGVKKVI